MKNLSLLKFLFLALTVSFFYSCGDDNGGGGDFELGPEISFLDGTGYIITDADLAAGESFSVNIRADKGDNDLKSLTIYQDGLPMENADVLARVTYGHVSTPNNPQTVDTEVDGFNWIITIVAQTDESASTYEFEVTDSADKTASTSLVINTVPVVTTDLGISIFEGPGCLSGNLTTDIPTDFCIAFDGTRSTDAALSTLTMYDSDGVIDPSRLNDFDNNPILLDAADANGFTEKQISIVSHTTGGSGYYAVLTDENGNTAETANTIVVTIGTAVVTSTQILLANAGGPSGHGGLDLDTGLETGSMDPLAELKDEGLDLSQPVDNNWKQRFSGTNGATVRFANNLPEGFQFENIAVQSEIAGAFASSEDIGNTTAFVNVGDQFVVENSDGSKYWYLLVTAVEETDADNADYYEFSIKE